MRTSSMFLLYLCSIIYCIHGRYLHILVANSSFSKQKITLNDIKTQSTIIGTKLTNLISNISIIKSNTQQNITDASDPLHSVFKSGNLPFKWKKCVCYNMTLQQWNNTKTKVISIKNRLKELNSSISLKSNQTGYKSISISVQKMIKNINRLLKRVDSDCCKNPKINNKTKKNVEKKNKTIRPIIVDDRHEIYQPIEQKPLVKVNQKKKNVTASPKKKTSPQKKKQHKGDEVVDFLEQKIIVQSKEVAAPHVIGPEPEQEQVEQQVPDEDNAEDAEDAEDAGDGSDNSPDDDNTTVATPINSTQVSPIIQKPKQQPIENPVVIQPKEQKPLVSIPVEQPKKPLLAVKQLEKPVVQIPVKQPEIKKSVVQPIIQKPVNSQQKTQPKQIIVKPIVQPKILRPIYQHQVHRIVQPIRQSDAIKSNKTKK